MTRVGLRPEYLVTGLVLVAALVSSLTVVAPTDDALWHYIGWVWAKFGAPPYAATVENKGPGIFSLYALSSLLFGVNFAPVRLLGAIAEAGTALALFHFGKAFSNQRVGLFAATVFGLTVCWGAVDAGFLDSTETFECLFTVLAFWLGLSPGTGLAKTLAAGIFLGLAVSFKQSAIFMAAALFGSLLLGGASALQLGALVLGGFAGLGLLLAAPFHSGLTFADYWQFCWLILTYPGISSAPGLGIRLDSFLGTWFGPLRIFILFSAIFFMKRRALSRLTSRWAAIGIWLLAGFVSVNASGVTHAHQVREILAPLSLVTALVAELAVSAGASVRAVLVLFGLLLFPDAVVEGAKNFNHLRYSSAGTVQLFDYGDPTLRDLGLWLRDHTSPQDRIYVFARNPAALVMLYSGRRSSTRFFSDILLYGYTDSENPKLLPIVLSELRKNPPVLVLLPADPAFTFPHIIPVWLHDFVAKDYAQTDTRDGYHIYRRVTHSFRGAPLHSAAGLIQP